MDEPRQNRPSGIPRPSKIPVQASKLPVPRANSIRHSPSRESLTPNIAAGTLRNPKLRTTPSRDRLAPTTTSAANLTSRSPTAAAPTRAASSPQTRHSLAPASATTRTTRSGPSPAPQPLRLVKGGAQSTTQAARSTSATTGTIRRQPSQQWISAAVMPQEDSALEESWTMVAGEGDDEPIGSPSKPRPSLAERTIETLSRLPSSPSIKGRSAPSFYETAALARKPPSRPESRASRPGSSHQSDGSSGHSKPGSRPGSSSGLDENVSSFRSQIATFNSTLSAIEGTPMPLRSRKSIQSLQTPSKMAPRPVRASMHGSSIPRTRSPSPEKSVPDISVPKSTSKGLAARPMKRPSVNNLFKKSSAAAHGKTAASDAPRKASIASRGSSATSGEGTNSSAPSVASANTTLTADSTEPGQAYKKTSSALREQIAKAKAAKRAAAQQVSGSNPSATNDSSMMPEGAGFDFGLSSDPFNQHRDDKSQAKILQNRLESARTSG